MRRILFFISIVFILSCHHEQKKNEKEYQKQEFVEGLPEMKINSNQDNYGGDIILHIQRTERKSTEITMYRILSDYNGTPVGFDLLIKRPSKRTIFVSNGITLRSLGDTSDNFLRALAEVYGVKQSNYAFIDSITVTYADLGANVDLNKPGNWIAAQMKLFFETDENSYELFLDVDEQAGTISLLEKDEEYRSGVISALSKKVIKNS